LNNDSYVDVKGLVFLEFTGPRPKLLADLFDQMGLLKVGTDEDRNISLFNQGHISFITNPSIGGNAELFRQVHTRGTCSMGFKVEDSQRSFELAVQLGAEPATITDYPIPAIKGVGESLIYLVDERKEEELFKIFEFEKATPAYPGITYLHRLDHLTHNLNIGNLENMCEFYENIFGFRRVSNFEVDGNKTGFQMQAVASLCAEVIIVLNESKDDKSQIAEFIKDHNGEGIQHIALSSIDLNSSVERLRDRGIEFQEVSDTYFDMIDERLSGHQEDVERLRKNKILIDGGEPQGGGFLLQIFTKNSIGPTFFEYIQRKGNDGFGEGNVQALWDSVELDQEKRGVLD
jgi:4-hydroxyphenylpyruvate dioxygenase